MVIKRDTLERKVQALCCGLLIMLAGLGALVPSVPAERQVWSIEIVDSTGTVYEAARFGIMHDAAAQVIQISGDRKPPEGVTFKELQEGDGDDLSGVAFVEAEDRWVTVARSTCQVFGYIGYSSCHGRGSQ